MKRFGKNTINKNVRRVFAIVLATMFIVIPLGASVSAENEQAIEGTTNVINGEQPIDMSIGGTGLVDSQNTEDTSGDANNNSGKDDGEPTDVEVAPENSNNDGTKGGSDIENDVEADGENSEATTSNDDGKESDDADDEMVSLLSDPMMTTTLLGSDGGATGPEVVIENDGYPYGKEVSDYDSSACLAVDIEGGETDTTTYQWQIADSKDGEFTDIEDTDDVKATESTYFIANPINRKWYRCVVNGVTVSKAVMLVNPKKDSPIKPEKSNSGWYVSNGKMGYLNMGTSKYDIVGIYSYTNSDGTTTDYWTNTSYNRYWGITGSTESNPASYGVSYYGDEGAVDEIKMWFDESNLSVVHVKCILAEGYHSMAVGTDTELGDYSFTEYSDKASLKAIIDKGTLKQVQIVAAPSLDDALDTDAAFVFKPITTPSHFWIGAYGQESCGLAFSNNDWTDPEEVYERYYQIFISEGYSEEYAIEEAGYCREECEEYLQYYVVGKYQGQNVVTEIKDKDSSMAMSWTNIQDGIVEFQYNIGSVSETGAETKSIPTSYDITVQKIDPNFYYALFDQDGNQITEWTNTPNSGKDPDHLTDIVFGGLDPDTKYVVKNIPASAYNPEDPSKSDVSGAGEEEVVTHVDPIEPTPEEKEQGVESANVVVTSRSITLEHPRKDHEYAINVDLSAIGEGTYRASDYYGVDDDDNVIFDMMSMYGYSYYIIPGTKYEIIARNTENGNNNSDKKIVKTLNAVGFVDMDEELDEDDIIDFFMYYDDDYPNGVISVTYDIKDGATINPPKAPTKAGNLAFEGWYKSAYAAMTLDSSQKWNFETDVVNSNTVLYAGWKEHSHNWEYKYSSSTPNMLQAYCSSEEAPCANYGKSYSECSTPLKVVINLKDAIYTGKPYEIDEGASLDTLSGVDSDNNHMVDFAFYVDAVCSIKTNAENSGAATEGGLPVNVGTYYVKITYQGQDPLGEGKNRFELKDSFNITQKKATDALLRVDPAEYTLPGSGEPVTANYVIKDGDRILVEGVDYDLTEDSVISAGAVGTYKIAATFKGNYTGTAVNSWKIVDANPPTGTITVADMEPSSTFIESIQFNTYYTKGCNITISAEDVETAAGDIKVLYYIAANPYSKDELDGFADSKWKSLSNGGSFGVSADRRYIIYAKITDASGQDVYISSDGFEIDAKAPVVNGIDSNKSYCNDTKFTVEDTGSGIKSILIDGNEKYKSSKTEYSLEGELGTEDMEHEVIVTDNAGNITTVSGIKLHAESAHNYKDTGKVIKESTCSEAGLMEQECTNCHNTRTRELSLKKHVYDYEDDKSWSVYWEYDELNNTYTATARIYCKNECGKYISFSESQCKIDKTTAADGTTVYTCDVSYDDKNPDKIKTFTMTEEPEEVEKLGENELSTGVIVSNGAPKVTVDGLTTENAKDNLSWAEKGSLEDDTTQTNINVFLLAQEATNVTGMQEELAENVLRDVLEDDLSEIKYIDLSMFKKVTDITLDASGAEIDRVESTIRIYDFQNEMNIGIDVAGLGFDSVPKGKVRYYYVARVHDYGNGTGNEDAEIVYSGPAQNGKIPINTQLFCPFGIGYKDVNGSTPTPGPDPDPVIPVSGSTTRIEPAATTPMAIAYMSPQTGDRSHLALWIVMGVIFTSLFVFLTSFLKDTGLFKIIKKLF